MKTFKTILIIDDEQDIREMLKSDLEENFNCFCLEAKNAVQASELCKDFKIDGVITDWKMPKGYGDILANLLTSPFVIYTGFATKELLSRSGDRVIEKPASTRSLYARLCK